MGFRAAGLGLVVTALACADSTIPGDPDAITDGEVPHFAIAPDSVTGWVGDTLALSVAWDSAPSAGERPSLTWEVGDTLIASLIATGDDGATVLVRGPGTTAIAARVGAAGDDSRITGIAEGDLLASYTFGASAWLQSPAVDDRGIVYVLRPDPFHSLMALDGDLSPLWDQPVSFGGPGPLGPAIADDGSVYFSAYRYTAGYSADGVLIWEDTSHTGGETAPAIGPTGSIYVGGARFPGTLDTWGIAAYAPSGARLFKTLVFNNTIKVGLTIVADSVVVGADLAGRAFGFSLAGDVVWVDTLPSRLRFFSPSVGGDGRTVYMPGERHVTAVDGLTGDLRWVWQAGWGPDQPLTPVVDRDGALYVQARDALTALEADGTVRWSADSLRGEHNVNEGGAPALAEGGVLYVACGADLCAVRTEDGSVRWRRPLPFPGIAGPIMITPDSAILFVTLGNKAALAGYDSARVVKLRGRFPLADAPWPVDGGNLRHTRRARPPIE